jgi:hypothetical protein
LLGKHTLLLHVDAEVEFGCDDRSDFTKALLREQRGGGCREPFSMPFSLLLLQWSTVVRLSTLLSLCLASHRGLTVDRFIIYHKL